MVRAFRPAVAVLVLVAGLAAPAPAHAGKFWNWLTHGDCDYPSYHSARYWTPELARCYDDHCGPRLSVYAVNLHPDIPPGIWVAQFSKCHPAPDPAATLVPVPTPPPTSQAR
jgi:hypothetical protein